MKNIRDFLKYTTMILLSVSMSATCWTASWAQEKIITDNYTVTGTEEFETFKINASPTLTIGTDATFNITKNLWVGEGTSVAPKIVIDGGTLHLGGTTTVAAGVPRKYNIIGHYPDTTATLTMNSGIFTVDADLSLGWHGKGTFIQNNGTTTIGSLHFTSPTEAAAGNKAYGTLTMNGGTLTVGNITRGSKPSESVINMNAGTLNITGTADITNLKYNGGTINITGNATSNDRIQIQNATVNFESEGTWTAARLVITDNDTQPTSIFNHKKGVFAVTGTDTRIYTGNSFMINHWNGTSEYNLSGGTLNATGANIMVGWDGNAKFNITGGTANAKGVAVVQHENAGGTKKLIIDGGRLNVGELGISIQDAKGYGNEVIATSKVTLERCSIEIGSATIGSLASWNSIANMKFMTKAEDSDVRALTLTPSNGHTITYSGNFSGSGNVFIEGAGKVIFSGENTHNGDTRIQNGGTLRVEGKLCNSGALRVGTGTLEFAGGTANLWAISSTEGADAQSVVKVTGGTLNQTGASNIISNGNSFLIGHWSGNSTWTLTGGTVNSLKTSPSLSWDGSATLDVAGGTANFLGLNVINHGNKGTTATLTVQDGGTLNLGAEGLKIIECDGHYAPTTINSVASSTNRSINLGDGTIGALANWNSIVNMTLTDPETGVMFNTSNASNPTDGTGHTITLSGVLSGDGGLNTTGSGKLILTGANTYTGATNVTDGTLQVDGSVASEIVLGENALLMGTGTIAGLSFAENSEGAYIQLNIDADNTEDYFLTVNGKAELQEGMFELLLAEGLNLTEITLMEAESFSDWSGSMNSLLSEPLLGYNVGIIGNALIAVQGEAVPEPATWILILLSGFGFYAVSARK
ncbi:MAG: autotransporter-associated beta strand repeat-containing protein [Planctomycetia bacterium]|nr:autotransporter-associated beta strand repeat-containing protein [Planctomycetia bacterium]